MIRPDTCQRFIFNELPIRGEIVRINHSLQTILGQKVYPTVIAKFLSETLLANILLCSTLKFNGQITMQVQQETGPIKLLVAKCDNHLNIRGVAQWDEDCGENMLLRNLQQGHLVITTQLNNRTDFNQSIVHIKEQPIAQVMEHFFEQSEQIPTRLWLRASENSAAGLLLQQLPDSKSQGQELWEEINMLTETITDHELLHDDTLSLLHKLYHEHDIRLLDERPVSFKCACSVAKMENAVRTAGYDEAKKVLEEFKSLVVTCEFCQHQYAFSAAEVEAMFNAH